jgi:thermostable 8-oxoguanine DNA glycosylase
VQRCYIEVGHALVELALPDAQACVQPGVLWGAVEAFPAPAYWAMRVLELRLRQGGVRYQLGATLREELVACLLGGHGIPGLVGVAAFKMLRRAGLLSGTPTFDEVHRMLLTPLQVNGRSIRYRFARQKARYIVNALARLDEGEPPTENGRALRDWLMQLDGVGPKTASWIVRNWLDADDVAILDIHVLRAGKLAGFFRDGLNVERHYLALEQQFLDFSDALGVRPAELDAVIWKEMAASPVSVRRLLASHHQGVRSPTNATPTPTKRRSGTNRVAHS